MIDRSIDPEKKKYFKIQANHKATPGSQYTQDSVKRKRVDQEVGGHAFQSSSIILTFEIEAPKEDSSDEKSHERENQKGGFSIKPSTGSAEGDWV